MDTITINTGRSGFVMIDKIVDVTPNKITTQRRWNDHDDQQTHTAIEALAQTGALHVRYLVNFSQHAFLLSIDHIHILSPDLPPGDYRMTGHLVSQSSRAFVHDLCLENEYSIIAKGRFMFALTPYDVSFDQTKLKTHYQKVFACLSSATNES